jgi:hypothetical protein
VSLCPVSCLIHCQAECCYAKCCYAECHYAECHYTEYHYAKCRNDESRDTLYFDFFQGLVLKSIQ